MSYPRKLKQKSVISHNYKQIRSGFENSVNSDTKGESLLSVMRDEKRRSQRNEEEMITNQPQSSQTMTTLRNIKGFGCTTSKCKKM